MTEDEELDDFLSMLKVLIERAENRAGNSEGFMEVVGDIGALIEARVPLIDQLLLSNRLTSKDIYRISEILDSLKQLEASNMSKVTWFQDFEDYMSNALMRDG
tara:strand:+ start:255 stop:563 length:309 start_codon:yes stop_codon:yes gene_type:complete